MCTLTAILVDASSELPADRSGLRVVMNRDERDDRPAALPPQWRDLESGAGRGIWPTDAKAGGTWIAATTHGLVFALMNVSEPVAGGGADASYLPHEKLSRGKIIPELVAARSFHDAMAAASAIRVKEYPPFQLIVFARDGGSLQTGVLRWNGVEAKAMNYRGSSACFASSGLGDHLVQSRLGLFDDMLSNDGTSLPVTQDNFHRHQWSDAPHLSVLMRRPNHRTVSITTVVVHTSRHSGEGGVSDYGVEMFYDAMA